MRVHPRRLMPSVQIAGERGPVPLHMGAAVPEDSGKKLRECLIVAGQPKDTEQGDEEIEDV